MTDQPAEHLSQGAASRVVSLQHGRSQWHQAITELEGTLSSWSLPSTLARRWLGGAQATLDGGDAVELYIELDPVVHLITVELWDEAGQRLYGIDDYLPSI